MIARAHLHSLACALVFMVGDTFMCRSPVAPTPDASDASPVVTVADAGEDDAELACRKLRALSCPLGKDPQCAATYRLPSRFGADPRCILGAAGAADVTARCHVQCPAEGP